MTSLGTSPVMQPTPTAVRAVLTLVAVLPLLLPSLATAQRIGSTSQPLATEKGVQMWTASGNVFPVPVCWETAGYDREKAITIAALESTWEFHANVDFIWSDCPTSGDARHIRVRLHPQDNTNSGAGGSAAVGMGGLTTAADNDPAVNLSFNPDGSADRGRVEYIAVHEFGHVLGFIHEQEAPGNEGPGRCNDSAADNPNAIPITPYDRDSVMNYCNRDGNMTGLLTDIDIAGVQATYGVRHAYARSYNSCSSVTPTTMASLAGVWNNDGQASVAVFPSDSRQFLYHQQWSVRDGGWGDEVDWAAGDFNGDGRTDIAGAWNNGGNTALAARLSTGSGFRHENWSSSNGGWIESTRWLPGDFNADGLDDLAGVWNDGGQVGIAVTLSDGAQFLYHQHWAIRDGGFGDEVKWFTGDFNGDGRDDLGAAWNNDGATTLTVRLSTGTAFSHVHWLINAGTWWDGASFVPGDYNGDGLTDVAKIWNEMGSNTISVALSGGGGFGAMQRWSERTGGWIGSSVKWTSADFNGDRRFDIVGVWNNGGNSALAVWTSNGGAFGASTWSDANGGFIPTTAWCAGTFDNSGVVAVAVPPAAPPAAPIPPPPALGPGGVGPGGARLVMVNADVDLYDVPGGVGRVIGILRRGEDVPLAGCRDDKWCEIAARGWVWGEFLDAGVNPVAVAPAPLAAPPMAPAPVGGPGGVRQVMVTADVDLYDVPGGVGRVIGIVRGGENVPLAGCREDQWCEIAARGWVWGEFLAR